MDFSKAVWSTLNRSGRSRFIAANLSRDKAHSAQCAATEIKAERDTARRERDDAAVDQQEDRQYSALFIDKLQSKIDRLKALCRGAGVTEATMYEAMK